MDETIKSWALDPTVGKFVATAVALAVVFVIARIAKGSISRYVKQNDTRYRLRKFITLISYFIIILTVSIIENWGQAFFIDARPTSRSYS